MAINKPNIVLVFADDLGIGDVSAFNDDAQFKTPNIDQLAKRGMMFTDSHATSALCTPSRYGLLTGRYNWRSRLKSSVIPGDALTLIEKDRYTLPQLLKDNGYNTAAVGKWHLGMEWELTGNKDYEAYGLDRESAEKIAAKDQKGRPYFGNSTGESAVRGLDIDFTKPIKFGPIDYGFDYFYGTPASLDQGPFVVVENDKVLSTPANVMGNANISRNSSVTSRSVEPGVAAPEYSPYHIPDIVQDKAMAVLDELSEKEEPFFLYYPNHLVHGPIIPQERFRGRSGIGNYGDFVLQLDSYVGEMIDFLDDKGIFDDTIFIFTSDNGVSSIIGLDELKAKGHDSSAGYRGHKMQIWEGGHREPTIVSYPKMIKGGSTTDQMVSHADFYATIAELLGQSYGDDVAEDSYSNYSLWRGKDEPVREDIVYSSGNGGFSIRRDFWKLVLVKDGGVFRDYDRDVETYKDTFKPTELYDLRDDISETNNVIDEHPDIVKSLMDALTTYIKEGRSTEGKKQDNAPDQPTGDWEQLIWMDGYEDYVKELNQKSGEVGGHFARSKE
ncbi:MAG: arylsulfatase [Aerococcus sp.]|nr:arylsulfatase [Aerococcus sp.]